MNPEPPSEPTAKNKQSLKRSFSGAFLVLRVAGLLLWVGVGIGLLLLLYARHGASSLLHIDQPTVVRQIAQLQRLETVKFTMDKIISGERGTTYVPKLLLSDRLLLVAHGEVIAGVDLSGLRKDDVSVQGEKVTVTIPKAQILVTRLDNAQTRVYSRDTGLFSSPDPNLETEVRQEAEAELRQAALDGGILKSADENARATVASLLNGLGFKEINFR